MKADDEEDLGGEGGDPLCNASDGDRMPGERRFVRTGRPPAMGNEWGGEASGLPKSGRGRGGGAKERRGSQRPLRDRATRATPAQTPPKTRSRAPPSLTCEEAAAAAVGLPKESTEERYWDSAEGDELHREVES